MSKRALDNFQPVVHGREIHRHSPTFAVSMRDDILAPVQDIPLFVTDSFAKTVLKARRLFAVSRLAKRASISPVVQHRFEAFMRRGIMAVLPGLQLFLAQLARCQTRNTLEMYLCFRVLAESIHRELPGGDQGAVAVLGLNRRQVASFATQASTTACFPYKQPASQRGIVRTQRKLFFPSGLISEPSRLQARHDWRQFLFCKTAIMLPSAIRLLCYADGTSYCSYHSCTLVPVLKSFGSEHNLTLHTLNPLTLAAYTLNMQIDVSCLQNHADRRLVTNGWPLRRSLLASVRILGHHEVSYLFKPPMPCI